MSKAKKGIKLSEEARRNISKGHIGIHAGDKNPMYGKVWTDEQKLKALLTRSKYVWHILDPAGNFYSTLSLEAFCRDNPELKVPYFRQAIEKGKFYRGWIGFKYDKNI